MADVTVAGSEVVAGYTAECAGIAAELTGAGWADLVAVAGTALGEVLAGGGTVLFCGNGGSAAEASHLAAELVGRLGADRSALRSQALTVDTATITAVGNDYGFDEVFARQVEAAGAPGDALVVLSTSGRSSNVVRAAEEARRVGMLVVALLGPAASPLDGLADHVLKVPGSTSATIQVGHLVVGHGLCMVAEQVALGEAGEGG